MKYCPNCGRELIEGWNHCPECGISVDTTPEWRENGKCGHCPKQEVVIITTPAPAPPVVALGINTPWPFPYSALK